MHDPQTTQTQFSLRGLLLLTTIVAAAFAVLGALGVSPVVIGVGAGGIVVPIVVTIALIEVVAQSLGRR